MSNHRDESLLIGAGAAMEADWALTAARRCRRCISAIDLGDSSRQFISAICVDSALAAARSRPRSHRMSVDLTIAAAAANISDSDEEDAAGDAPPADSPSKLGSQRPPRREPPPPRSPPPPRPPPPPAGRDAGTTAVAEAAVEVLAPLPRVTDPCHVSSRDRPRHTRVISASSPCHQTCIRYARG